MKFSPDSFLSISVLTAQCSVSIYEIARSFINMIPLLFLETFLLAANIVSLTVFGIDKLKSKRGNLRIPESKLLLVAFFGPFGAYMGMLLFRHKTRKVKFLLVPLFLLVQLSLMLYFYIIR
jgi:uncharacterized membrane protein YsdA (DUF1294 family)